MNWLGCAPITNGRDGLPVPVHLWDDISARAGVTEGLDQWRDRLARFAGGGDRWDVHVAHGKRDERGAASLSEYIEKLAADVSRPCGRWSEWAEWASGMLRTYLDPEHQAEGWPRSEQLAARQVQSLLDDLGALNQVASEADLTTFRHAVEEELATRRVRDDAEVAVSASEDDGLVAGTPDHVALPGPFGSGVFVGTPYEARGLSFDRVYVVGLADQYFPGTPGEGSLFAETEVDDPDWPTAAPRGRRTARRRPLDRRPGRRRSREHAKGRPPDGARARPFAVARRDLRARRARRRRRWPHSPPTSRAKQPKRCRSRETSDC